MRYTKTIKNIRNELQAYITDHGLQSLVLGISGGIDSALCAALVEPVCKQIGIPLIGRSIPIETNKQDEIDRAKNVGETFCTEFQEIDLTMAYRNLAPCIHGDLKSNEVDTATKIRQGNIKARLRMVLLYDTAAKNRGIVLSTDNLTEYLLGFWTLHGDHADYGMIQNMWKSEVYEMAEELYQLYNADVDIGKAKALKICIDAIPTDGLGITNSDLDQLGADTYDKVDDILKSWLIAKGEYCTEENKEKLALWENPVVKRHEMTHFKRKWPITIPRDKLELEEVV